jgi:hypothetical protein
MPFVKGWAGPGTELKIPFVKEGLFFSLFDRWEKRGFLSGFRVKVNYSMLRLNKCAWIIRVPV